MISNQFRKSVRSLNHAIATASLGASYIKLSSRGPPIIRIHGRVYHNTYVLHLNNNEYRKYGQLYIIDNEEGNKARMENNQKCRLDLLR